MPRPNLVLTAGFCGFLALMFALNMFTPVREFSPRENRYLARLPRFSGEELVSGNFTRKFEEFLTDQFAGRDRWVLAKSDLERLRLMRENNGILLGRNGYLLEHYRRPGAALAGNLRRVNSFAAAFPGVKVYLLLAPNSVAIHTDKLPPFAVPYDQRLVVDQVRRGLSPSVKYVDVLPVLAAHSDQYIYFRTDHHWTMRGAYLAYRELAPCLGFEPWGLDQFKVDVVSREFQGTYAARANTRWLDWDYIEVFRPREPIAYSLTSNGEVRQGLYQWQQLNGRDKYSFFLGGNQPLMVINSAAAGQGRLAVFKDSYAHSLLPFLANHYSEIHVIDLRYFTQPLARYIQEHQISSALFLFNIASFSADSAITRFR